MDTLIRKHIIIISPALAAANNGNWHTARRWQRFLQSRYKVTIAQQWDASDAAGKADLMIALHARRSAAAIAGYAAQCPSFPLILVLTGTDLYRDIRSDAHAQASLRLASHLVVLQQAGLQELPRDLRARTSVIYQSAPALKPHAINDMARRFKVVMIGHLREEKDPTSFMAAAALSSCAQARFIHIGGATDDELAQKAIGTQAIEPRYRWLGSMPHGATRQMLKRSQLMVIASRMEGGANVIAEAVTSGVPVVASDIAGNRGMLGDDYAGYFPAGDASTMARLIDRAAGEPAFHEKLKAQCALLAQRFAPEAERACLLQLVDNALNQIRGNP